MRGTAASNRREDAGADRRRVADEGEHAPVVRCVGGHIEEADSGDAAHGVRDLSDARRVAALGNVRDAFDDRCAWDASSSSGSL
jgi:hypothetical protein